MSFIYWFVLAICAAILFLSGWLAGLYCKWQLERDTQQDFAIDAALSVQDAQDQVVELKAELETLKDMLKLSLEIGDKNAAYLHFLLTRFDTKGAADVQP